MKSRKAPSENTGSILKLGLERLLGIIKTSLSQYFLLLAYTDIPNMCKWHFFLSFSFLKENILHFCNYNIEQSDYVLQPP